MRLNTRATVVVLHDVAAACLAWLGAYFLRFNLDFPAQYRPDALSTLLWVVPLQAALFWFFGLYRGIWRFASLPDLKRILIAVAAAAVAVPLVLIMFRVQAVVPRSVLLLDPLLLVLIMGGSRLAYRAWKEHRLGALLHPEARPVLVLGAGSAADFLLRELARNPSGFRAVGLLDDDPDKLGRRVQDVPVLGRLEEVTKWARRLEVNDVILALPSARNALRKRVTELCTAEGLNVLSVPSLEDLMLGRVTVAAIHPIQIEDLLGRDPVNLDDAGLQALLCDRVVMVTGAGGSIGTELCRQIARFHPAVMVLVEQGEHALYCIEQEFSQCHPQQRIVPTMGDVKDAARMRELMQRHRPAVVFHAAAYKHVPLMEENALQALRNNTLGTYVLGREALAAGVEKFVMVSTDKAVNPTNVMGASKRLAEMVCQMLQSDAKAEQSGGAVGTRFVSVRFGNVLGSSGSVVPKFQAQIAAGGPVTVTHPEITRYFMTIPEACQLVLQAALMGEGGEIFVLDMGEPVKIVDLARLMIRLAGKSEAEIPIAFTGLRPGEKLYEELLADAEHTLPTPHPKLRVARARPVDPGAVREMLAWLAQPHAADAAEVRRCLCAWVEEYSPADLDHASADTLIVASTGMAPRASAQVAA